MFLLLDIWWNYKNLFLFCLIYFYVFFLIGLGTLDLGFYRFGFYVFGVFGNGRCLGISRVGGSVVEIKREKVSLGARVRAGGVYCFFL